MMHPPVLLIHDHPKFGQQLETNLRQHNHFVTRASTLSQGIVELQENDSPVCIVRDTLIQVRQFEQFHRLNPAMRILVVSEVTPPPVVIAGLKIYGVDGVFLFAESSRGEMPTWVLDTIAMGPVTDAEMKLRGSLIVHDEVSLAAWRHHGAGRKEFR